MDSFISSRGSDEAIVGVELLQIFRLLTAELGTHLGGTGIAAAVDHLDPDQVKALAERIQKNDFLGDGLRDLLDPRLRGQT